MPTDMTDFNLDHIKHFRFAELFNELGWERPVQQQPFTVDVDNTRYLLQSVANKRGVQILQCQPNEDGRIPSYAVRQKIERRITREVREHLIVFVDQAHATQIWQWVNREPGRLAQYRELVVREGQASELLRQKLGALKFTIDEEELLTVLGVTARLDDSLPRDRVTKKFYKAFEKQRKDFAEFIAGIPRVGKEMHDDQRWYTAVLIDRLMFLWFLQEKRFLDGNRHYLAGRFASHQTEAHEATFYRRFLCPLFFRGFAEERNDGNRAALRAEFGDVPYLNGGLFAQHQLEQKYGQKLNVADAAFEKLFAFFAEWDWHLDDRPLRSGREINPDVLGYIFEQFVNQKQMGAYYTKEDITEYIGKNTIIPCLLGKVRAEHPAVFDALAWPLLQQSGDAYIYTAMLKGLDLAYPDEISRGLDTEAPDLLQRRKPWNRRADEAASLPTEIWRETIARQQHTRELRRRIADGELREIGDLITNNLDIRQFAQDLIEGCTDLDLLRSFWFNLAGRLPRKSNEKFRHGLSVLDPTCGSGAFLFAALNILKPLYDATLRTLHAVRSDALIAGEKSRPEKWRDIDEILERFAAAADERQQDYAVTKHIIVHNLYGVDIEEQATEIAKLRLFLKLVALLEPGDAIEPLPDIDFNIRHGNTLVGYATAEETERAVKGAGQANLFQDGWGDIRLRLLAVQKQYDNFQIQQVQRGGHVTPEDKQALTATLAELEETLNHHLARDYGVDPEKPKKYAEWKAAHQPFHWYVNFYPLMAAGGFDAIVGNPPWMEYSAVKSTYRVIGYETAECGNLYGLCSERAIQLRGPRGAIGFIVQLPLASASRMQGLRTFIQDRSQSLWVATFDDRPSKLFEGLQHCRSTIFIAKQGTTKRAVFACSRYQRWPSEMRQEIFSGLLFCISNWKVAPEASWPKVGDCLTAKVLQTLLTQADEPIARHRSRTKTKHPVYYQEAAQYWIKATSHLPYYAKNGHETAPSHGRCLYFDTSEKAAVVAAALNSSLFYAYFVAFGDCFHVTDSLVSAFPLPRSAWMDQRLATLSRRLMQKLVQHAARKTITSRQTNGYDIIEYDEYFVSKCKDVIDEIDVCLAGHLGCTEEQTDAIGSFDLKFRVGEDSGHD